MNIETYGFSPLWQQRFDLEAPMGTIPARVLAQHKSQYIVATQYGEKKAELSGKYHLAVQNGVETPTVGDWVYLRTTSQDPNASIDGTLTRSTYLYRKDSFNFGNQALAANIDTILLCMSLDQDFSLGRMERYLTLAYQSGADIAILLTKSDLPPNPTTYKSQVTTLCGDLPVHLLSCTAEQGLTELQPYFVVGKTVVAVGSSGVGKSTLLNAICGEQVMATGQIREDDHMGRHTTVHRQIILLPNGGLFLDTPGLREVGLTDAIDGLDSTFADIDTLHKQCRFSDCTHKTEPGCAIQAAIRAGTLDPKRLERYHRLAREANHFEVSHAVKNRPQNARKPKPRSKSVPSTDESY